MILLDPSPPERSQMGRILRWKKTARLAYKRTVYLVGHSYGDLSGTLMLTNCTWTWQKMECISSGHIDYFVSLFIVLTAFLSLPFWGHCVQAPL